MCCSPDLPCNVGFFFQPWVADGACVLCGHQRGGCNTTGCGSNWPQGQVYGQPTKDWIGHGTKVWLIQHGEDPPLDVRGALIEAKEWFRSEPHFTGRGHFVLRDYNGHWALERFTPAESMPFPLSNAMEGMTDEAVRWFFDTDAMLDDPAPYRRKISDKEIAERIEGYQFFIDKETARPWNQEKYLKLPPLCELPDEQQRRLVGWWDRLWFDFLDLHPDWRWTPMMGFYKAGEQVYPLV